MKKTQRSNRLILIGGPIASGKSTVALRLANRLNIKNIVHTDTLRNTLRYVTTEKDTIHYSSYRCYKRYGNPTKYNIRKAFIEQCVILRPLVDSIIDEANEFGKDTIIEGVNLLPHLYYSLLENKECTMVMLDIQDKKEHLKRFHKRSKTTYRNKPKHYYKPHIKQIREVRNILVQDAEDQNIDIIESSASCHSSLAYLVYQREAD